MENSLISFSYISFLATYAFKMELAAMVQLCAPFTKNLRAISIFLFSGCFFHLRMNIEGQGMGERHTWTKGGGAEVRMPHPHSIVVTMTSC